MPRPAAPVTPAGPAAGLVFHPITPHRWPDLEALFGPRGACGGCWCMWWRLPRGAYEQGKGEPNRQALRALVNEGVPLGVLAYEGEGDSGQAAGWCAVAPRADYPRLARSRLPLTEADVEGGEVWSITCLFVARAARRRGVSAALVRAAADYAQQHGAGLVEAYPVVPRSGRLPDAFAYTGLPSVYRAAGFVATARPSASREVMVLRLNADSDSGPDQAAQAS